MTTVYPDDGMCHETSGFLFSHRCDRFSNQKCLRCQKPLCDDHAHQTPEGVVCTTCLKRQAQAERNLDDTRTTTTTGSSYHEHYYYNDPYFYGPRYYPGYGHVSSHSSSSANTFSNVPTPDSVSGGDFGGGDTANDPLDFTEGDAASMKREEDADFETDMGAS